MGEQNTKQDTLHKALAKAQSEFKTITKDSTAKAGSFTYSYASLDSILEEILPILHNNGLYVSQSPINDGERVGVETKIIHAETGEMLEGKFTLKLDKDTPQGAGSAITYAKRYAIQSMLGLNFEVDTDALPQGEVTIKRR
jgi:hypothetical protein